MSIFKCILCTLKPDFCIFLFISLMNQNPGFGVADADGKYDL